MKVESLYYGFRTGGDTRNRRTRNQARRIAFRGEDDKTCQKIGPQKIGL